MAHIIPYSFGRHAGPLRSSMPNVYRFLRVFAGPSVVDCLDQYFMVSAGAGGRTSINRLENLLCLLPASHDYFGQGLCILEPVGDPLGGLGDEEDSLESYNVHFTWLTRQHPPAGREFRGKSKCQQVKCVAGSTRAIDTCRFSASAGFSKNTEGTES